MLFVRNINIGTKRSRRMTEDDLNITNAQLLENLGLVTNGKLKRAAVMLFHRNQEKWFSGAYIKIGYFETDADLRYQDEIHGSLLIQADRVIELIYLKYMKAEISYDNVTRVETYPVPKAAVREAVYNALIHCDYSACVPIQISVHADKMYIGNSCVFPADWTVETLMQKHNSPPHNPDLANGFLRAGLVEIWGRGIEKICSSCRENGVALPEYLIHAEDILVKFTAPKSPECPKVRPLMTEDMVKVMTKGMTELERSRFTAIWVKLDEQGEMNSATAAKLLNVEQRTARRLLNKAEKLGLITSEGKTSDKVYKKR